MIRLIYFNWRTKSIRHKDDIQRIVRVCRVRGRRISSHDAASAWGNYSEAFVRVTWADLPSDDSQLYSIVLRQCIEQERET